MKRNVQKSRIQSLSMGREVTTQVHNMIAVLRKQ